MLKKLVIVNLLLLFLPFFQTCSDDEISHNSLLKCSPLPEKVNESAQTGGPDDPIFRYNYQQLVLKKQQTIRNFCKAQDELTITGYGAGILFVQSFPDVTWAALPWTLSLLLVFLMVGFAFAKKHQVVFWLGIANLLLLTLPLLLLWYGTSILQDINQLKVGWYLLVYNGLMITFTASGLRKNDIKNNDN